jgi:hypothetical protein
MTRLAGIVLAVILASPGVVTAHRLDEYLQASRVTLDRDRVMLEIDLTPGANMASAAISLVDLDDDETISPAEAAAYGRRVLADFVVTLDRRAVVMNLVRAEVPSSDEMRDGLGTIRLTAVGEVPSVIAGRRQLFLRNAHEPHQLMTSVYLANAMIANDEGVAVVRQSRDPRQQELRVDYEIALGWSGQFLWLAFGVAALTGLIASRRSALLLRAQGH